MSKQQKAPERKEPPPVVRVAFAGSMAEFRLYADPEGRPFVRLPSGKRGYVAERRDGTFRLLE